MIFITKNKDTLDSKYQTTVMSTIKTFPGTKCRYWCAGLPVSYESVKSAIYSQFCQLTSS